MADYQRVVEYLRDLRSNGSPQQVTEEITRAAEEYAAFCVSANERLRQCTTLLGQGLRSEAIHLAEQSPNLLDLVAALDLPDPETWVEFCTNNGLAVAPPLQMDRATQVNEAYSNDGPLEGLLGRHRRLALARAAVRERLDVLRQIASVDAGNTSWEKDIRVFERARLKELPGAFHEAMKEKDEGKIGALKEEIKASWLEPMPADLSTAVAEADARFRRLKAEVELRPLMEPLREAFAARDVGACKRLVGQWRGIMQRHATEDLSAGLVDELKPVVAFIGESEKREARRKKFAEACGAFGAMLDRDAPEEELEPAYARLGSYEEAIPAELTERYKAKQNARERAVVRKHRMRLVLGLAAVLAIGATGILFVMLHGQTVAAQRWAGRIREANGRKDLKTADELRDQAASQPGIASNAEVLAAERATTALHKQYEQQRTAAARLAENLTTARDDAAKVLADANVTDDVLADTERMLQRALDEAAAAGDLSWGDTEGKLPAALNGVREVHEEARRRTDAAAQKEIGALAAQLDALPSGSAAGAASPETREALGKVADRVAIIRGWAAVGPEGQAAATALAEKLGARQQIFAVARNAAGALLNIRQDSISAAALGRSLDAFVKRFPTDARAREFAQAEANLGWAEAAEAWKRTAPAGGPAATDAADAAARGKAVADYLAAYPGSPLKGALTDYGDYLKRMEAAIGDKPETGTWATGLGEMLTNPLLAKLQYLERSDGKRFYVLGDIKRQDLKIKDQTTVIFQALDPKDASKRVPVLVDTPLKLTTDEPVDAPHTKLVAALASGVKGIDASNWDSWGIDAADQVRDAEGADPVVRAVLLQKILKVEGTVAGPLLGDAYAGTLAALGKVRPDDVAWLDPSAVSDSVKKGIADAFAGLPASGEVKKGMEQRRAELFRPVAFEVAGTGVLMKSDGGEWELWTRAAMPDGTAYTVLAADGGAGGGAATTEPVVTTGPAAVAGALVRIGTVSGGKASLDAAAASRAPQGSVVYILRP